MSFSEPLGDGLEPSFEELYEDAPCGYVTLGPDGTVLRANRTLLRALGREATDVRGCRFADLLAPGSRIYHATHWGPLLELQDAVREIPVDLIRGDGSRMVALLSAFVTRDDEGRVRAVRASLFDASDRRRYERELVRARDDERAIRQFGQRALAGLDGAALRSEARRLLRRRLDAEEVTIIETAEAPVLFESARDTNVLDVPLGRAADCIGRISARRLRAFTEGERGFAESFGLVLAGAIGRERADRSTYERARQDPLTELPNELALRETLEQLVSVLGAAVSFPICLLDLVGFRLLNESRGHRAGDALLRDVAARLRDELPLDMMLGRVGSDEFLVIAPVGWEEEELAEVVSEALLKPFTIDGFDYRVQLNMGTLSLDRDAKPDECGVMNARIAMHLAKTAGLRALSYRAEMRERSQERMRIEAELAVALREGQLRVFYQPVVALADHQTVSTEALVRWEHPERGLLAPAAFIPVAEETDLICEIGEFVLAEATRQLAAWRAAGVIAPHVSVAVNVSSRQFNRASFPTTVLAALEAAGLAEHPELLGLEITETMLMDVRSHAAQTLTTLSQIGVGLLLDDFGTGVSSLARLKRLPVDTLKIDRAFIAELGLAEENEAIVAAILAMAAKLGLRIVAEGAETDDQLHLLTAMGCERVQGYVFSRPLPAAEFASYVARGADCDTRPQVPWPPSPRRRLPA